MIFIFLLALILFGPKRLPEIAREVGKFMAEFKRASNDFKYQLQSEIDKAGANPAPPSKSAAQQSTAFTPTLLPPAAPSTVPDADGEHERLMKTARMAFEAQNFTLRPPEPPPVPSTALESPAPQSPAVQAPAAQANVPAAPSGESHASSPAEAHAARPAADSAPEAGNSALHS